MPLPRRLNDSQTEKLLAALKADLSYRQSLAKKISEREGIAYNSAMRRLQRYVTDATEKRSFARAPVVKQRVLRQVARSVTLPPLRPIQAPEPLLLPRRSLPSAYEPDEDEDEEIERTQRRYDDPNTYEKRAIIAYFDGDAREAARALGVNYRLLDLVVSGTAISPSMGGPALDAAVIKFLESISDDDYQDIKDFDALLHNLPEWEIEIILDDLADGDSTFADWMDQWRDVDMDFDDLMDSSEWWALWRSAYKKAKG